MKPIKQEFTDRLLSLEQRAKAAGGNITRACKNTGIARATYERWGHRPPQTIVKLQELEDEVARMEREAESRRVVL